MTNFKNRVLFNIVYYFLWVAYFLVARLLFLSYYFDKTSELGFSTALKTFIYGIQLDFSFAAYIAAIPFLIGLLSIFINK